MIKLSIIATDAAVLPLIEFFAQSNEVSLHQIWIADELQANTSLSLPEVPLCESWNVPVECALEVDGLLVAGVNDETIVAAKQFLAGGGTAPVFILTETPGDISTLFQFMSVWQDAPNRVIPLFQSGVSGTFAIAEQKLGEPIQRIAFHRQLPKHASQKISLNDFDHALLQDLDWIQSLGNFSHVSTWLTGEHDEQAVEATLTLTGDSTPETKWTLSRSNDAPQWQLFLYGEQQTLTVECLNQRSPRIRIGEHEVALPVPNTALADLLTAMRTALTATPSERRSWMDVVRNGEVGAAARRSIVRKRTIPIHFEDASERSHFKSQMTAIGCGVLLWIMFGVIGVLTLASIVDPRDREFRSASAAGFVLHEKDFQTGSKEFNLDGLAITNAVADQWSETTPVLIIEETGTDLDRLREQVVEQELISRNLREVEGKVVLRPLTGEWFENVLWGAWAIVFLPLAIILIAQALLFVARPISED